MRGTSLPFPLNLAGVRLDYQPRFSTQVTLDNDNPLHTIPRSKSGRFQRCLDKLRTLRPAPHEFLEVEQVKNTKKKDSSGCTTSNLEQSHCEAGLHKTFLSQPRQAHHRRPIPLFPGASGIKQCDSETRPKSPPRQPRLTWSMSHPMNPRPPLRCSRLLSRRGKCESEFSGGQEVESQRLPESPPCRWRSSSRDSGDDSPMGGTYSRPRTRGSS